MLYIRMIKAYFQRQKICGYNASYLIEFFQSQLTELELSINFSETQVLFLTLKKKEYHSRILNSQLLHNLFLPFTLAIFTSALRLMIMEPSETEDRKRNGLKLRCDVRKLCAETTVLQIFLKCNSMECANHNRSANIKLLLKLFSIQLVRVLKINLLRTSILGSC